jgi:beta-catenin-like protein 1
VRVYVALFENLLELRPELAEPLARKADFLGWALGRLKSRVFDQNRQYTSEILAIVLQTSAGADRQT